MKTKVTIVDDRAEEIEKIQTREEDDGARDGEQIGRNVSTREGEGKEQRTGNGRKYIAEADGDKENM